MAKRLSILALGSRGDVQPYVALGKGLVGAGYRVRVATFESFKPLVAGQGLDFLPVPGDAQVVLASAMGSAGLTSRNPISAMRAIMKSYGAMADHYSAAFSSDILSDSDAILNQLPGGLYGTDLAEKLRVPYITLSVIPLTPTAAFANPLLTARSLGAAGNRVSYRVAAQLLWAFFRPKIAHFRRKLGLGGPSKLLHQPPGPVINGFSPLVIPPPKDWNSAVHTTGFWLLDETGWQPPAALLDFLNAGDPPVFIGFGSMIVDNPLAVTQIILDAVAQSGRRAVISSGWANIGDHMLPDSVYRLDYAPYTWLFPRMAAIIHHGGSGTTGLALRSGVPSMVVAFGADQPVWGKRTYALGVGVKPLRIKYLNASALADAIHVMCTDQQMRQRAAAFGQSLRQEDGITEAVNIIGRYIHP